MTEPRMHILQPFDHKPTYDLVLSNLTKEEVAIIYYTLKRDTSVSCATSTKLSNELKKAMHDHAELQAAETTICNHPEFTK
jgi:hypothetical protein